MKILLALDASTRAMDEAARLARERSASLTALFVLDAGWNVYIGHDWLSGSNARAGFLDYVKEEEGKAARAALDEFGRRAAGVDHQVKTAAGEVTDEILAELAAGGYDLLVMAAPFRRGLEVVRDAAGTVLRRAKADVLFVREP